MLKTCIRIIMAAGGLTVMGIGSPWAAEEKSPPAGEQKMTLMLGGQFCDNYPEEVEMALKKVPGVEAVDLKSMPRHAVVEVEPGKPKPGQLVAAVNGVKGAGWYCTAQLGNEGRPCAALEWMVFTTPDAEERPSPKTESGPGRPVSVLAHVSRRDSAIRCEAAT